MPRRAPIEPPPTRWELPPPESADEREICGVGADLEPGTLLTAYRTGLFPMRLGLDGPIAWWSPDPRGVIPLDGMVVSRSLRRSQRRFELRVNTEFEAVMRACADPSRPHGWIDESFVEAYRELHRLGWAHSIETWHEGELVGGLYGLAIGGFFAGESMFHHATDASKVALLNCVELLQAGDATLFDVQWVTPHLESLGARPMARSEYLERLRHALARPGPSWPASP
ncbi:MAG: leucyl/phenylalanyl-tRNA--protein transferase [Acidimicrobiia bacterium]